MRELAGAMVDGGVKKPEGSMGAGRVVERVRTVVEGLEPRRLMAVDLTAAVAGFTFRGGVSAGTASAGVVTVVVSNRGPGPVATSTADVLVAVKLRPANTGGGKDVLLSEAPVTVAGLGAGREQSVRVPVVTPARLGGGVYSVVAVVDAGGEVAEVNEGNNVGILRGELAVRAVHPDLAVTGVSTTLGHAKTSSQTGTVTLKNAGDVALAGTVDVEFVAARVGATRAGSLSGGTVIGTKLGVRIGLAPGGVKTVTGVSLDAPTNDESTLAATFNVWARIVPHLKPVDLKVADDAKVGTPVVVAGNPLANPLTAVGLGTRLMFTATGTGSAGAGGGTVETGAVSDGAGHAGTYSYRFGNSVTADSLELSFAGTGFDSGFTFFAKQPVSTLGGRTLTLLASGDLTGTEQVVAQLNIHVPYWLVEG